MDPTKNEDVTYNVQTGERNNNFYGGEHHHYPPTPDEIVGVPQNLPLSGTAKFVGRDGMLDQVRKELAAQQRLAITAIQGMGGIGKTELALQYALKFYEDYQGGVCWLRARQEIATQIVDFGRSRLNLRIPDSIEDINLQVAWCWQHWPQGRVLLVLDDVVEYERAKAWLPNEQRFQILLTTRETLGAGVARLELEVLTDEASMELLASLIGEQRLAEEKSIAQDLCRWVGNLPLGLELVGRYLARKLDLTLAEMLERLKKKRLESPALQESKPEMTAQLGVQDAFELSWAELSADAKRLAGLLGLFAVAPISWEWLTACWPGPGSETLEELRDDQLLSLHLVQRVGRGIYQLHPLVREFFAARQQLRSDAKDQQQSFAEAMVAIAQTLPQTVTLADRARVTVAVPHLEEVAARWSAGLEDDDKTWCCVGLARFYQSLSLWVEAERCAKQGLTISQSELGERHPSTASSLNNLASLYLSQGRYGEAEPLYVEALEISQSELGERHPDTARSLNNLAALYRSQGRYGEAEPLYVEALEIYKSELGERHPDTANSLNNLALLYESQGHYGEAEPLYVEALEIRKSELGERHPDTASSLNNLAALYCSQGRYGEAEPLYVEALEISQSELGERHPDTAGSLFNLAALYYQTERYPQALTAIEQALQIYIPALGADHPNTQAANSWLQVIQQKLQD